MNRTHLSFCDRHKFSIFLDNSLLFTTGILLWKRLNITLKSSQPRLLQPPFISHFRFVRPYPLETPHGQPMLIIHPSYSVPLRTCHKFSAHVWGELDCICLKDNRLAMQTINHRTDTKLNTALAPKGPDSFISTYKFYEMWPRRELAPPPYEVGTSLREILDPPLHWLLFFVYFS